MNQTCQQCNTRFEIDAVDQAFYQSMNVPPPTFCWRCRMQRRFTWRNERKLYPGTCAKTGKPIITMFNPEDDFVVYDRDTWWQDDWSATDFGQAIDWDKPFFLQFQELTKRVPMPAVFNSQTDNCNYSNHIGDAKDCYLSFATWGAENVSYGHQVINCRDSFDISASSDSELVYNTIGGDTLYNAQFVQDCSNVRDSMLLYDCRNVHDCFGSTNLRNKSFVLFNEQLTEEEYKKRLHELDLGSYSNFQAAIEKFNGLKQTAIHRFAHTVNTTDSTGENLVGVSNSQYCFDAKNEVVDCRYMVNAKQITDSRDGYGVGVPAQLLYEGVDAGVDGERMAFVVVVWGGYNMQYSYNCFNSHDCFGSVGLRNASYCIFNKQYTKEEYEELLPKLIQHMNDMPYVDSKGREYRYGEFFPVELSPFPYNATVAQEHFPLTAELAAEQNWRWIDERTDIKKFTLAAKDMPDAASATPESITNEVIQCAHTAEGNVCGEQCTGVFKILPKELEYLQKRNIALPRLCSNCRHFQRLKQKNPLNLWERTCMCVETDHESHQGHCTETFSTSYAPECTDMVYCANCYRASVE